MDFGVPTLGAEEARTRGLPWTSGTRVLRWFSVVTPETDRGRPEVLGAPTWYRGPPPK